MITVYPATFKAGLVSVDFGYDWSGKDLDRLRRLCKIVEPDKEEPAYKFFPYYHCRNGRWYGGESKYMHNPLREPMLRKISDIYIPELDDISSPQSPERKPE